MLEKKHWEKYWQNKVLTSLPTSFSGNYEGNIYKHWETIFINLVPGDEIVDIACGNLPISIIALEIKNKYNLDYKISACDYVKINLSNIKNIYQNKENLDTINLYSNVDSENLTFDESRFNLVTSMYGFEYANSKKTLESINRILKPRGKIELICHTQESKLIQINSKIYKSIQEIKKNNGVLDTLKKISNTMGVVTDIKHLKNNNKTEKLRLKLNKKLIQIDSEYGAYAHDTNIHSFIRSFFKSLLETTTITRKNQIKIFQHEMEGHESRLKEMLDASLTVEKLKIIQETCNKLNMTIKRTKNIFFQDHNVGLSISMEKMS